ncbi:MAG: hypothetical protein GY703_23525 [Gammaproteobacteria bacterium]|nr:hypothetical protein [Gammaproteobacteria bacterium]
MRWLDQIEPLPVLAENMVIEELQAITVDLDGGPGALADEPVRGDRSKYAVVRRTVQA